MRASVLVAFLILSAAAAFAQTETARISGRVTDLTGAVIVGAECKITNIETDVSVTTTLTRTGFTYSPTSIRPCTA